MTGVGLAGLFGWTAFAVLGVLSLWPGGVEFRTGLGSHLEHFAAYAFTGFLLTLAQRGLNARFAMACLLGTYAAALERLQLAVPDRTSQFADLEGSAIGAFAGLLAAVLFEFIALRERHHSPSGDRDGSAEHNEAAGVGDAYERRGGRTSEAQSPGSDGPV